MSHDLSFVDPERRAEVQRRIDAIERFLAAPGRAQATSIAAELGLGPDQFYRLVRAWTAGRRPHDLAQAVRRRARRPTPFGEQETAIVRAVEEQGADASVESLVTALHRMAGRDGLRPHGLSALRRAVSSARRERLATTPPARGLIIAHSAIDVAVVAEDGTATMAIATVVLDPRSGGAVGIALDAERPRPQGAARAIVHALRRVPSTTDGRDGAEVPVALGIDGDPRWPRLAAAMAGCGLTVTTAPFRTAGDAAAATAVLGDELLGTRLRPRATGLPASRRRPSGTGGSSRRLTGTPVDAAVAEQAMRVRMDADGPWSSELGRLGPDERARLADALDVMSGRSGAPTG